MHYESYPWKQDLLNELEVIKKYNQSQRLRDDSNQSFSNIEKSIIYSAFIIRKLIDSLDEVSDEVGKYELNTIEFKAKIRINLMRRFPDEETHDWNNPINSVKKGREICNLLIHSYGFAFICNKYNEIDSFVVTSDRTRNDSLYKVDLHDWINFMNFVAEDEIIASTMVLIKGEFEYRKKERK